MRNRVAHEYWAVVPTVVWQVATEDLGPLLAAVESFVVDPTGEVVDTGQTSPALSPDGYPPLPGSKIIASPSSAPGEDRSGPGRQIGR